ncbi:MAG: hypothetical protein ACI4EC_07710 [Lachnospiraceae bacterium]
MKLKYYLRGIGIGVIVTTVILMIAFAVHREQPLTDDEIRERASELGMVMPQDLPASDKLSDTEPSVQSGDMQQEIEDLPEADGKSSAGASDGKTKNDEDDSDTSVKEKEEDKTQSEIIEQAEISIVGGEYSDDVCKKLKKAGIIEDADDFNKYLAEGGYDNLIQPGNYVIPLDADYDSIIKLITEKKR